MTLEVDGSGETLLLSFFSSVSLSLDFHLDKMGVYAKNELFFIPPLTNLRLDLASTEEK